VAQGGFCAPRRKKPWGGRRKGTSVNGFCESIHPDLCFLLDVPAIAGIRVFQESMVTDSDFKHAFLSIGSCRTPVNRALCMVECPKIPLSGGTPGCRDQPCSPQHPNPAPRRAERASGPRRSRQELVTRSGADRIRSPAVVGRPVPIDHCPPVASPRRPPTAVVRVPGRSAAAGWVHRGVQESGARYWAR
jgi:hypothetical protein